MHADAVDTTNFDSTNGKRENIEGLGNAMLSLEGPYDQGVMAFTAGQTYAFTLNAGVSAFAVTCRITDITPTVNVEGVAVLKIDAVSTGDFTPAST